MNILVTGGSGFIGTNLIKKLLTHIDIAKVVNVDKKTYASNDFLEKDSNKKYVLYEKDILDTEGLAEIITYEKIDHVIHMAAESHVDNSINGSKVFLETNVLGTGSVLDAFKKCYGMIDVAKHRFIHVSTDEVFGSLRENDSPFNVNSPYRPLNPYSASKAASDHLVQAYGNTFGINYTITNCSNNFGPYQHPEKFVPTIIYKFLTGQSVPVYGTGKNIRDWIYVEDHAELIIKTLLQKHHYRELFGGLNEISNIDMVLLIADKMVDMGIDIKRDIQYVIDRKGHDFRYAITPTRIHTTDFDLNLKKTISWYVENRKWVERKLAQKR